MRSRHAWTLAGALPALPAALVAAGEGQARMPVGRISALLNKHPQTCELTVMRHLSNDDFGFHLQTGPMPMGDSVFPRYRISAEQVAANVRELARVPLMAQAGEGKRSDRFRPKEPEPAERVYSLTLRCGNSAFFEDVQSGADMRERADSVWAALKATHIAAECDQVFRSRIGKWNGMPDPRHPPWPASLGSWTEKFDEISSCALCSEFGDADRGRAGGFGARRGEHARSASRRRSGALPEGTPK